MFRRFGVLFSLLCFFAVFAQAHNPDTSYLRCVVSKHELNLRFSFDLATLYRVVGFDVNATGKVTQQSMEELSPLVYDFLEESVLLEINGKKHELGARKPMGWPPEAGDAILEKNYHDYLLNFTFVCPSSPLIEDITVTYEVFPQLSSQHKVMSDIEQDGRHLQVDFSEFEPDYLYDTGWTSENSPTPPAVLDPPAPQDLKAQFRSGVSKAWSHFEWPIIVFLALLLPGGAVPRVVVLICASAWILVSSFPLPWTGESSGFVVGLALAAGVACTAGVCFRRWPGRVRTKG